MQKHYIFLILITAILLCPGRLCAQEKIPSQYQRDSLAMEEYADYAQRHLSEPIILKMSDTLFDMAGKIKHRRRQVYALSFKVDYYYIKLKKDSLFTAIDKAQQFAKEYGQNIHYFFFWERKITYYLRMNQFNLALNELNMMDVEAIKSGDYNAQVSALNLKGRIYYARSLFKEAAEYYHQSIDMIENAPEGIEISNQYSPYLTYSRSLQRLGRADEMKQYLDKALTYKISDNAKCSIYLAFCDYYLNLNDISAAEHYLQMTEDMGYDKMSVNGKRTIFQTKLHIARRKEDYKNALAFVDSMKFHSGGSLKLYHEYGSAYYSYGKFKEAAEYYRRELSYSDSVRKEDIRNELSEMLILMDVNKIKAEKDRAELEMKNRHLRNTTILSSILFVAFIFITVMFVKYYRTNKKLTISEGNLGKAVAKLEEESRIKSDFLRHLSHEVRTPLNSIVGFTDLLSEKFHSDLECTRSCELIDESSQNLLKLVNDAVEMSDYATEGKIEPTDINSIYPAALEYMEIKTKEGVKMKFIPCADAIKPMMMDKGKVTKIIANLLHNSAKFTTQGEIVLQAIAYPASKLVIYTVTDTGPGIPDDKQKDIFEYFTKVDTMTQGLGLGLPLSRHLAESMGGTLSLDASYTKGCRMVLRLEC